MKKAKREWTYIIPEITSRYWILVMVDMPDASGPCFYGLDNLRAEMHAKLAAHYGLTHEQTKEVTDHMDRLRRHSGGCSMALHEALQGLWEKYPEKRMAQNNA